MTASSRLRREGTHTQLGSVTLPTGVLPLFFAVKILFLVGRGIVFLEVARPPDFEMSPSWGVAQKEASVSLFFFFF